ncbi:26s proteasome non-atpase regulatory subunit 3 like protein a [Quercus suber]|uniref:26s proteasome non-atpase regulatory subunit 3 like protein a n=1 Tax=Quercus suber TaxID=58331 RepID=A0AAW0LSR8_QUESU
MNLKFAFNSRIAFCLNMHNKAVRVLRFPSNSNKEKESDKKRRERQQQEQELAKHIAEEDDRNTSLPDHYNLYDQAKKLLKRGFYFKLFHFYKLHILKQLFSLAVLPLPFQPRKD